MDKEREASIKVKAACLEYFTTQQALLRAEDEHLQLQAIVARLESAVETQKEEVGRLQAAKANVDDERDKEAELPTGVPVAAFDAFVNEQRRLLAEAAQAEDELLDLAEESAALEADLVREGGSARVMEDALDAQIHFSEVLRATAVAGGGRIDAEHGRQATACARRQMLLKELASLKKREGFLAKALRAAQGERAKAQGLLQERDSDVVRLRRDAALSRRLYMSELEHAREQEAELLRLTTENRRLNAMVEARRAGRPTMRRDAGDAEDSAAGAPAAETYTRGGKGGVRVVVESNDEVENILRDVSNRPAKRSGRRSVLDACREHNVALLQQMVATMQALRVSVEPVQGAGRGSN
jgi:chromosome segregation ATPase